MEEHTFQFQLNEIPPFFKNLAYALQWVMIAIPNIIVFSGLGSAVLQLDPAAQISFSQRLLLVTGLMTLLQSLKGHRFPILEGPSSAFTLSFIIMASEGLATIGNPLRSSEEQGVAVFERISNHLAAILEEVKKFDFKVPNEKRDWPGRFWKG